MLGPWASPCRPNTTTPPPKTPPPRWPCPTAPLCGGCPRPRTPRKASTATAAGWAVSCPRANGIATCTPQGEWRGLVPLPDVCPLAVHGGALWAGGLGGSLQNAQAAAPVSHAHGRSLRGVRLDNHWVLAA